LPNRSQHSASVFRTNESKVLSVGLGGLFCLVVVEDVEDAAQAIEEVIGEIAVLLQIVVFQDFLDRIPQDALEYHEISPT
jgi:hypothetical protein